MLCVVGVALVALVPLVPLVPHVAHVQRVPHAPRVVPAARAGSCAAHTSSGLSERFSRDLPSYLAGLVDHEILRGPCATSDARSVY